jgi:hypothetical protein
MMLARAEMAAPVAAIRRAGQACHPARIAEAVEWAGAAASAASTPAVRQGRCSSSGEQETCPYNQDSHDWTLLPVRGARHLGRITLSGLHVALQRAAIPTSQQRQNWVNVQSFFERGGPFLDEQSLSNRHAPPPQSPSVLPRQALAWVPR